MQRNHQVLVAPQQGASANRTDVYVCIHNTFFFFQGMLKKDYPISDRFLLCHVPQNLCQRHQFPSPLQGREDLMHRAGCDIVVSKGKGGRLNRSRQILHIQRIYKRW